MEKTFMPQNVTIPVQFTHIKYLVIMISGDHYLSQIAILSYVACSSHVCYVI